MFKMNSKIKKIIIAIILLGIILTYSIIKLIPQINRATNIVKKENTTEEGTLYTMSNTLPPDTYSFEVEFFDFNINSVDIVDELPDEVFYDDALQDDREYLNDNYNRYAIVDVSLTFNYDFNKEYVYSDYEGSKELYLNCLYLSDIKCHEPIMVTPKENSGKALLKFDFDLMETKDVTLYYPISDNSDKLYFVASIYGWNDTLTVPEGTGGVVTDGIAKVDITNLIK